MASTSGRSGTMTSTFETVASSLRSCAISIATRSGENCVRDPKTGSGAAFFTMRPERKDALKLSRNGLPTNGNELRGSLARLQKGPTQANRRLEWATRPLKPNVWKSYTAETAMDTVSLVQRFFVNASDKK